MGSKRQSGHWDSWFMQLAQFVATGSKDPSTQVGSVIVGDDHRIISVGFNGFAKGIQDYPDRLNDRDLKYKLIIHAEENAILHANRELKGTTLYCYPYMPCANCASRIIQSGITRVVATNLMPERWLESLNLAQDLFKEAGVKLEMLDYEDPIFKSKC